MAKGRRAGKTDRLRILRVFVASPSDVREERARMAEVRDRVNRALRQSGVQAELWRYEHDALPALGEPQELIDPELDQSHVVIVILWTRFGEPGKDGLSGTAHEIERSIERWRKTGTPRVLIYECTRPAPPPTRDEDAEQTLWLTKLKSRLRPLALFKQYLGPEDFEKQVRDDVELVLRELAGASATRSRAKATRARTPTGPTFHRDAYLAHVEQECGYLSLTGLLAQQSAPAIPIGKVYVTLRVSRPDLERQKAEAGVLRAGMRLGSQRARDSFEELASVLHESARPRKRRAGIVRRELVSRVLAAAGVPAVEAERDETIDSVLRRLEKRAGRLDARAIEAVCSTVEVDQVFRLAPRILIEGDPGSGKTTALQKLAMHLVEAQRTAAASPPERTERPPMPVFIPLRRFRLWMAEQGRVRRAAKDGGLFVDYLKSSLAPHGMSGAWIDRALPRGKMHLLLDGLDEVPERERQIDVATIVSAFAAKHGRCPIALTSRPSGLPHEVLSRLRLAGAFAHCRVQPLDEDEVERYVQSWYQALEPAKAAARAPELVRRIRASRDVAEIADTPLTLTAICVVDQTRGVPETRAELYEHCVRAFVHRWDANRDEAGKDLCGPISETGKVRFMQEVALEVHAKGTDSRAIERGRIADIAHVEYSKDLGLEIGIDRCREILELTLDRSGLLLPEGIAHYRFRHLVFQEFLTARRIVTGSENVADELAEHLPDAWWRVVVALTPAFKAIDYPTDARRLLREIGAKALERSEFTSRVAALVSVAQAAMDLRSYRVEHLGDVVSEWANAYCALLGSRDGCIAARDRALLSRAFGSFGHDPRLTDALRWVSVPAGPCWISDVPKARRTDLPPFAIQRWPVTVEEYLPFATEGYDPSAPWWTEEARGWLRANQVASPSEWPPQCSGPTNLPVAGVSWFEACAYCDWQSMRSQACGENRIYRLPSRDEWEKASRGGIETQSMEGPEGRRTFSWGPTLYEERGIAAASVLNEGLPVGWFPLGDGPYGTWDQNCNVLEWCQDTSKHDNRVLRSIAGVAVYFGPKDAPSMRHYSGASWRIRGHGFRPLSVVQA